MIVALTLAVAATQFVTKNAYAGDVPNDGTDEHCVVDVSTSRSTCFATFEASMSAIGGGQVESTTGAAAGIVLGIWYEHRDFAGASTTFVAPYGCDNSTDIDWFWNRVSLDWNDRVSSFNTFANCRQVLYADADLNPRAGTLGPSRVISYVGPAFNDRASSVHFQ
jgi:hypothetical protein